MAKYASKDCCRAVDFKTLEAKPIQVRVDGQDLPLMVGSKVVMDDDDKVARTVMKIQVNEDGSVLYYLKYFNGVEFCGTWTTAQELYYMHANMVKRGKVTLS